MVDPRSPSSPISRRMCGSKSSLRYASRTRGNKRSWEYDSAVSEMASSSSVNKLLDARGSVQSNVDGA